MIIGFDNGGQTCNVFWSYVYFLHNSIATGERTIVPIFEKTLADYPLLIKSKRILFPYYNRFFLFLLGERRTRSLAIHCFNNALIDPMKLCKRFPNKCINGFEHQDVFLSESEKQEIRKLFVPTLTIAKTVESVFDEYKSKYDVVIGLHIRRGDYLSWRGGKYFFSFDSYRYFCGQVLKSFSNKKVIFFIASNEDIPTDLLSVVHGFQLKENSPTHDLYALSLCDYIVGPPSTFSRFAAFRGNIPIATIIKSDQETFVFQKLQSLVKYESGKDVDM